MFHVCQLKRKRLLNFTVVEGLMSKLYVLFDMPFSLVFTMVSAFSSRERPSNGEYIYENREEL